MKRYLVLGSKGQLGQSLVKVKPDEIELILTPGVDICNFLELRDLLDKEMPDAVINCAAYTAVDNAEDNFQEALEVNAYGVANIAQLTKERNIPFVHVSTDYVFNGMVPATPHILRQPINVYGYTKMLGEDLAKAVNPETNIIRTASVYSEFGKNFLKALLGGYHSGRKEFDVVCDHFSCPTYAPDVAEIIYKVLKFEFKCYIGHYAGDKYLSWDTFARMICKEVDPEIKINPVLATHYKSKAQRPANSMLVTSDFGTGSNVEHGIKQTLEVLMNKEYK